VRDEGDDVLTPPVERIAVSHEANRPLVLVLGHHALVLEETRARVTELRDRVAAANAPVAIGELAEIGRVFRREGDSAGDLARAAEKAAAGGR
jgi:hypothetical protein